MKTKTGFPVSYVNFLKGGESVLGQWGSRRFCQQGKSLFCAFGNSGSFLCPIVCQLAQPLLGRNRVPAVCKVRVPRGSLSALFLQHWFPRLPPPLSYLITTGNSFSYQARSYSKHFVGRRSLHSYNSLRGGYCLCPERRPGNPQVHKCQSLSGPRASGGQRRAQLAPPPSAPPPWTQQPG